MRIKSPQAICNQEATLTIREAIEANPLSRKSIQELVPGIYIGRNQLQISFKQITGMTITHFRLCKRMEAARNILTTGVTVKEAAFTCGYKRQSNFSRDYKNVFGVPPMECIRNQYEQEMKVLSIDLLKKVQ
ncbi:helix-turn-helix transcriptional regulator [Niastella caeni]|uniref:Helix-turn-helix transcriptional regulator n=1 Tax=Niastella caeni TaxID=2569763 RepID=A0A4S8HYQ7_9BACT|nr:AraC family transcriptional regulator [Niastella caeni]THU40810.1 helix-turn-helix transcriptional regulator [Niastella caeni]